MPSLTVRLTQEQFDKLQAEADLRRFSVSDLVRERLDARSDYAELAAVAADLAEVLKEIRGLRKLVEHARGGGY